MAAIEERPTLTNLHQQIGENILIAVGGEKFIQKKNIDEIFTRENITRAVDELHCVSSQDFELVELAEEVFENYRTVFAILIWIHREDDITVFRRRKAVDDRLPLSKATVEQMISSHAQTFVESQCTFLPYYFESGSRHGQEKVYCHEHIASERILPFTKETQTRGPRGNFGEISMVTIPISSQAFLISETESVVVVKKKIKRRKKHSDRTYEEEFTRELRILSFLRPLQHRNVIRLLASYTYNNEHNFLMPCLDMSLKEFLHLDYRFGDFRWDSTFYLALYGLGSALESLHEFRLTNAKHGLDKIAIGYHHDFRTDNILVTKETFVLTDFGLGMLKLPDEDPSTQWFPTTSDYMAPECEDQEYKPQSVSQKIDSWAYGCLVADLITYMQQGPSGVDAFLQLRRESFPNQKNQESTCFYRSQEQLKPCIFQWLDQFASADNLGLIETARSVLIVNPEDRPSMSEARCTLAVPTLRVLVQHVLEKFKQLLDTRKTLQRLSMNLWWAHAQIDLFNHSVSDHFDDDTHFARHAGSFEKCSDTLVKLLRELDSILQTISDTGKLDMSFDTPLQSLAQCLANQLPTKLKERAEAKWFVSLSEGHQNSLIKNTYVQSHEQRDQTRESVRQHMRDLLTKPPDPSEPETVELYHDHKALKYVELMHGHYYGLFNDNWVLVESMYWKPEDPAITVEERHRVMQRRAQGFSQEPKPAPLCLLKCLGFVDERRREDGEEGYSFLYELPPEVNNAKFHGMVSLAAILNRTAADKPTPRDKFQLAYALATFVQEFHLLGCLHETFCARNIVFLRDPLTEVGGNGAWGQYYVIGLQKSRPEGQNWSTEGPAEISLQEEQERHPDYQANGRFLAEYEYYSLGIILLQIGSWSPVLSFKVTELKQLRENKKHAYLERLSRRIGQKFTDVIRVCLDRSLDRDSNALGLSLEEHNQEVLHKFQDKVVTPLAELASLDF
ncbi:kinase-like protein [Cucurbitaria berberidis CBS 394.84]|uniref:Kinase-like protein n=1 Tax=Cucurbitaria berberidis CBS 394.84 TaxID=1168544 RepID=A0A9P4GKG1_9PLEO|nr:kinase-like protein [Cucurbitaria berberidis CBS 394.84]KAF1847230.1 kinase-like protein [Cucurbitaria berberidis CBS 394.84]